MPYGLFFLLSLALLIFALFNVIATERSRCRNLPKELWVMLIIFLPTIGSVAWLLFGRPEKTGYVPGRGPAQKRDAPPRPPRPLGPDDDPRFFGPPDDKKRP